MNVLEIFENKNAEFEEKTILIISKITCNFISNCMVNKYVKAYLNNVDLENFKNNNTFFDILARTRHHVILRDLILNKKVKKYINLDYCLLSSIENSNYKAVKLLLKNGADINFENLRILKSVLLKKDYDIFKLLLEHKDKIKNPKEFFKITLSCKSQSIILEVLREEYFFNYLNNKLIKSCKGEISDYNYNLLIKDYKKMKIGEF
jgi:hypothetical protein